MVRAMEFVGAITTLERFSPKNYPRKTVKSYKTFEDVIEMYFDITNHIKFGYYDHFVHRRKKYLPPSCLFITVGAYYEIYAIDTCFHNNSIEQD